MAAVLPFLFVGCWNRPGPGRDSVLKAICDDPVPRLVLGGDNIYPEKTEVYGENGKKVKSKKYSANLLEDGLSKLGCKILLGSALGNHNVSSPEIAGRQIGRLTPPAQTYFKQSYADADLIFLDTNVEGAAVDTMLSWLSDQLAHTRKPYYIIQHEPVIGFKKDGIHALQFGVELMDVLITYPPRAILCADTHHYQYGVITHKGVSINQHIVGAGGASHDTMDAKVDTITQEYTYTMRNYIPGYGYARVTSDGVEFVRVADWSVGGTRRAKRRARKSLRKSKR
jgi:hypothetical protein